MKRYRKFGRFIITELSGVDRPAQEHAKVTILKRDNSSIEILKRVRMTTSVDGHAHLIYDDLSDGGDTSHSKSESEEYGHSHPWAKLEDGSIKIGESEGHSHLLESTTTSTSEKRMPDDLKKLQDEVAAFQKNLETLTAENERLKSAAALSPSGRKYLKTLDENGQTAFLKMSPVERDAVLLKNADSDPVVYTTTAGIQIRKSAGDLMVQLAKRADESDRQLLIEKAARENAELTKRAGDTMAHLPGTEIVKVEMLRSIDRISDEEVRKAALETLKAADSAMSPAFKKIGVVGGSVASGNPSAELEKLAEKIAGEKKIAKSLAMGEALNTPEGAQLYKQIEDAKRPTA